MRQINKVAINIPPSRPKTWEYSNDWNLVINKNKSVGSLQVIAEKDYFIQLRKYLEPYLCEIIPQKTQIAM